MATNLHGSSHRPRAVGFRLRNRKSFIYEVQAEEPELELKVTVYNINTDKGSEVLKKSRTLREYMEFVNRARQALAGKEDEDEKREALGKVIDGCINDGILVKLLQERREEIIVASILEYDQAAHEAALHEDGYEEGYNEGHEEGYKEGRAAESANTEAERKRADTAESRANAEKDRANAEKDRADAEKDRADTEKDRADAEKDRADAAESHMMQLKEELDRYKEKFGSLAEDSVIKTGQG